MTNSYTQTNTFTVTHAKQIASKVAADLQRFQRLYGSPTDQWISNYEGELVVLLQHDAVKEVVYGFQRNNAWTEAAVKYKALGGVLQTSDDPGKILPNLDVSGATFTSFLTYSSNWTSLSQPEKDAIKQSCPFVRGTGEVPHLENGYWSDDHSYSAGGRGLGRSSVKK